MKLYKDEKILFVCLSVLLVAALAVTAVFAGILIKQSYYKKHAVEGDYLISYTQTSDSGREEYVASFIENGEVKQEVYTRADRNTYIGQTLKYYYLADNPAKHMVINPDGKEKLTLEISALVSAFLCIIMLVVFLPLRQRTKLLESGSWKLCRVKKVEKLSFGRCRILCDSSDFPALNKKPFYSSPVKRSALTKKIKEQSLSVYYDEKNPKRYYVKIDEFRQGG